MPDTIAFLLVYRQRFSNRVPLKESAVIANRRVGHAAGVCPLSLLSAAKRLRHKETGRQPTASATPPSGRVGSSQDTRLGTATARVLEINRSRIPARQQHLLYRVFSGVRRRRSAVTDCPGSVKGSASAYGSVEDTLLCDAPRLLWCRSFPVRRFRSGHHCRCHYSPTGHILCTAHVHDKATAVTALPITICVPVIRNRSHGRLTVIRVNYASHGARHRTAASSINREGHGEVAHMTRRVVSFIMACKNASCNDGRVVTDGRNGIVILGVQHRDAEGVLNHSCR